MQETECRRSPAKSAWWRSAFAPLAALHVATPTAMAQVPARLPNEDSGMLELGVAAALAVIIGVTAFINPKRSHRD